MFSPPAKLEIFVHFTILMPDLLIMDLFDKPLKIEHRIQNTGIRRRVA